MRPFKDPRVAAVFDSYPVEVRQSLMELRELVFSTAEQANGVGPLVETLKWGEPAYLTESGSGSTVRLGWKSKKPDRFALHFICTTKLIERFRTAFPRELTFDGNRSILFDVGSNLPMTAVRECVEAALTYHLRKKA